jgi:tRNA pseudouridine38-40 synthase
MATPRNADAPSSCSPSSADPAIARIAIGLEYDGSAFLGWQTQPGGGGIQDAVERALAAIATEPIELTAAGRTDRGVHARAQVAHFDTRASRPPSAWVRGVNSFLPGALAVLWSREVDAQFHARYSALARTYRYELVNRPVRPALCARHAGWYHAPLDVDAMREGARALVGEHDFSAFRAAQCQAKTPVRSVHSIAIERQDERIQFTVRANAFLHHMVRNIVGSLVYVGAGKQPTQWIGEVLRSKDRNRAAPTFAPEGLYLERIEYEEKWGLPQ